MSSPVLLTDLSDDVLREIFSHVSPLRDQFSLAAVNQQFRRCVLRDLRTPRPLNIDLYNGKLNGEYVSVHKFAKALRIYAEKTEFSHISIAWNVPRFTQEEPRMSSQEYYNRRAMSTDVLKAICKSDCVNRLRRLEVDFVNLDLELPAARKLISHSPMLSALKCELSLGAKEAPLFKKILHKRALTELHLTFTYADKVLRQSDVIALFQSLQPNTLKNVVVDFKGFICGPRDTHWDLDNMFSVLRKNAWANVESLEFNRSCCPLTKAMFTIIAEKLTKCTLFLDFKKIEELSDSVTAYFSNIPTGSSPVLECLAKFWHSGRVPTGGRLADHICGCDVISQVRKLRKQLPDVDVVIDTIADRRPRTTLTFRFNNASVIVREVDTISCQQTTECNGFYANALYCIWSVARNPRKLGNWFVDKCKIGVLIQDLNRITEKCNEFEVETAARSFDGASNRFDHIDFVALSAELNEAQNMVTVNFERKDGSEFSVNVGVHHCFNDNCLACFTV